MRSKQQEHTLNNEQGPAEAGREEHFLPSRKTVHPTEKERWVRFFYRSLLWIFVLLVAGLLFWGWRYVSGEA